MSCFVEIHGRLVPFEQKQRSGGWRGGGVEVGKGGTKKRRRGKRDFDSDAK